MPAQQERTARDMAFDGGAVDFPAEAASFLRGTRIATDTGERAIETILPGATVMTLAGQQRRVTSVAQRRLDLARHPWPERARPVRLRRGALGNGVPARDLLVSPDHGICVSGTLVPARALVNGATVVVEAGWSLLTYHSLTLAAHDVLLAEGAPAESSPVAAPRAGGAALFSLHPCFPDLTRPAPGGLARAGDGLAAQQARAQLLTRARLLGHTVTRDPDLHLLINGHRLRPATVAGHLHRFDISGRVTELRLVSRSGVPAELDPASQDRRRLGVMVSRVVLRAPGQTIDLPATDPGLRDGFHPPERDAGAVWRWTNGNARLEGVPAGLARMDVYLLGSHPAWARG